MSGTEGHAFEVAQDGEIVWEYVNPVSNRGILTTQGDEVGGNSAFRIHRYGPDFPGLAGKDLTPGGPITESTVEGALDKFRDSKLGFDGDDN